MAGKLFHIGHDNCLGPLPGAAADSPSEGNMHTGHRPLKRTESQLVALDNIETSPEEAHRLVNGSTDIGHERYLVVLALDKGLHLSGQQSVFLVFFHRHLVFIGTKLQKMFECTKKNVPLHKYYQ